MAHEDKPPDVARMEELAVALGGALGLRLEPEWVPGIAQQLMITLGMVKLLETVDLDEEVQPAPVYRL